MVPKSVTLDCTWSLSRSSIGGTSRFLALDEEADSSPSVDVADVVGRVGQRDRATGHEDDRQVHGDSSGSTAADPVDVWPRSVVISHRTELIWRLEQPQIVHSNR